MYENRMSQKTAWLALVAALVFACAVEVTAAVPPLINYQGRLTNSVGTPLDTTVALIFQIYAGSNSGTSVTSGVCFYKLTAGDYIDTKKMTLLK